MPVSRAMPSDFWSEFHRIEREDRSEVNRESSLMRQFLQRVHCLEAFSGAIFAKSVRQECADDDDHDAELNPDEPCELLIQFLV